jgi:hypothetical protein
MRNIGDGHYKAAGAVPILKAHKAVSLASVICVRASSALVCDLKVIQLEGRVQQATPNDGEKEQERCEEWYLVTRHAAK